MNPLLLWCRLRPLLSLYQDLLGVSGMFKMLLSGFMLSLIELGGLALIFPFLKLVTDQDFYQHIVQQVEGMPLAYALEEHQRAVLVVGIGLVLVYIFRGWFSLCLVSYQASVAARTSIATSDNFVTKALASRYQLFLKHSPGKIAGVSHCNTTHVMLLFQSLSSGINEVILFSLVLSGLIFVSPAAFFGLAMLVLAVGLGLFRPIARRAATIGQRTKENDLGRYRFIVAVTNAIRDIKIMGLEASFTRCNRDLSRKHANLAAEYTSVSAVQRIAVEVVFACSVVVAAIWFAWVSGDLKKSAPLLATVGLVAVRTVPVLSRLAGAYSGVRYSLPFVESLLEMHQELGNYQQHRQAQTVHFPGEYCATNLCFSYGRREVLIDCSLRISQGEIVAIVGPSGAGKSTLLDVLVGLQPPTSGSFTLNGVEFSPFLSANFPAYVGYVPQTITLLDSSLAFNIALEEEPDSGRLQQSIECAGLAHLIDDLPQGLQTLLGEGGQGLSGGQRQRVGIARALYRKPALLILDEATSALDEAMAHAIMAELLAMRGQISMIFVTHDLHLVPADRIYQLDQGRISAYTARNPSRYESALSD